MLYQTFKKIIEKADAITVDSSPMLTHWSTSNGFATTWEENDLEYECDIQESDIINILFNKNSFEVVTDTDTVIVTLFKIEVLIPAGEQEDE